MKAKEYYEKYKEPLMAHDSETLFKGIHDFMQDLSDEMNDLIEKRHCQKHDSIIGVIKEINQKYNSVRSMFEKEYGYAPIKRNGFNRAIVKVIPEYAEKLITTY